MRHIPGVAVFVVEIGQRGLNSFYSSVSNRIIDHRTQDKNDLEEDVARWERK